MKKSKEFLVVQLVAALSSFSEGGGATHRPTGGRPTRSALLGLAGAALGVRRDDAQGQERLHRLGTAVCTLDEGAPLHDYHTYQSAAAPTRGVPLTRRQAMASGVTTHTRITHRSYRQGGHWLIAYHGTPAMLDRLQAAFLAPKFFLYVGRKACPLGAPLDPKRLAGRLDEVLSSCLPEEASWIEVSADFPFELPGHHVVEKARRDNPHSRTRWQFVSRTEYVAVPEKEVLP